MSTLEVSNISDGTTSVPADYVVNGSAKAWCNYNQEGTHVVRDSLNISSITDEGSGDSTLSFTSSLSDTNYSLNSSPGRYSSSSVSAYFAFPVGNYLTGEIFLRSGYSSGTSSDLTPLDSFLNNMSVMGDLA